MTAKAARSAEEALAAAAGEGEAGDSRVPENHPGDVRTYPPGARIVNNTLELPDSGISSAEKAQEAFRAAEARRDGVPFAPNQVEMGARSQPSAEELARIARKARKTVKKPSKQGKNPVKKGKNPVKKGEKPRKPPNLEIRPHTGRSKLPPKAKGRRKPVRAGPLGRYRRR